MALKYVFGPVGSRRLGVSLGVDLVTRKTCSQNCPYCEAGLTTLLTLERREYVPAAEVEAELEAVLSGHPKLDWVTFSGAGEPTLNSGIGEVAAFIKHRFPEYRLCLLTNGTLLGDPEVAREVACCDLVVPDLDASNSEEFELINHPVPGFTFERFVDGLRRFSHGFKGRIYLEMFLAEGVNDSDASLARFVEILRTLRIDRVQLNTLDRPGCDPQLKPVGADTMRRFIAAIEPVVPVEAVGRFRYRSEPLRDPMPADELSCRVVALAGRRQVTFEDIALAAEVDRELLRRVVDDLVGRGLLTCERGERGIFYQAAE
ncbi:MAG: radical SAM protein [Victivallaceae bacterium]|nr:radical SAM protein [Victivallaceae bacterium]